MLVNPVVLTKRARSGRRDLSRKGSFLNVSRFTLPQQVAEGHYKPSVERFFELLALCKGAREHFGISKFMVSPNLRPISSLALGLSRGGAPEAAVLNELLLEHIVLVDDERRTSSTEPGDYHALRHCQGHSLSIRMLSKCLRLLQP